MSGQEPIGRFCSLIPGLGVKLAPAAHPGDPECGLCDPEYRNQRRDAGTIFTRDAGPPEGGTGRRFFTDDKRADLTVQFVPNLDNDTPATFLTKKSAPPGIIYKRITADFFVVSSICKDRIWYNRCNRANGALNCVLINYPAAEKRQWDGVVTRISHTLRG